MPRINVTDDLGSWMSLQPDMAPGLVALSDAVYAKSKLPLRVHEIARMRIALANGCEVCRNARYAEAAEEKLDEAFYRNVLDWPNWSGYNTRERLAAEYAEGYAQDHLGLREDNEFWLRFRENFSDAEIVDLVLCCTLWLGAGRTMRVLDVGQTCSLTMSRKAAA
ncbi:carboxymuconolactone decarboxylase family protein [Stenotrophobium rhamnosiphilum]|uniref:Carboxymuconolactone decarboxylase n=1 Tax=Stenotrophobium rhamnosiphilum TaxID=2029166 RepID=A0A2T5MG48_9GAMM|nr:carboxymuconolactone decarboxylase family protein [Stenotrophobium rhamnosiphilum]PTU31558.1 carboxymuconolactone decarboxylase [Stenotrophobium rhamnosiphilum]